MPVTATAREVFETRTSLIAAGRWTEIADLYAEDTVVETPFALPHPHRAEGREAVRAHFARSGAGARLVWNCGQFCCPQLCQS